MSDLIHNKNIFEDHIVNNELNQIKLYMMILHYDSKTLDKREYIDPKTNQIFFKGYKSITDIIESIQDSSNFIVTEYCDQLFGCEYQRKELAIRLLFEPIENDTECSIYFNAIIPVFVKDEMIYPITINNTILERIDSGNSLTLNYTFFDESLPRYYPYNHFNDIFIKDSDKEV